MKGKNKKSPFYCTLGRFITSCFNNRSVLKKKRGRNVQGSVFRFLLSNNGSITNSGPDQGLIEAKWKPPTNFNGPWINFKCIECKYDCIKNMMSQCLLSVKAGYIMLILTQSWLTASQEHQSLIFQNGELEPSYSRSEIGKGQSWYRKDLGKIWWARLAAAPVPEWMKDKKLVPLQLFVPISLYTSVSSSLNFQSFD